MFSPFTAETLTTSRSAQEVADAVAAATERQPLFANFGAGERPFVGEVRGDEFVIRRRISYRNPFVPILEGRIAGGDATSVTVVARPSWPAIVAVAITSLIGFTLAFSVQDLLTILLIVAPWLMCGIGYAVEAEKAERLLSDVIGRNQRTIVPAPPSPPAHP